eukprot:g60364.t1
MKHEKYGDFDTVGSMSSRRGLTSFGGAKSGELQVRGKGIQREVISAGLQRTRRAVSQGLLFVWDSIDRDRIDRH